MSNSIRSGVLTKYCLLVLFALIPSFLLTSIAESATEGVAKVMILKGEVSGKGKDGKDFAVKKDQWIQEGTLLKTSAKSFVKLMFVDKSQMNLGPESEMEIAKFPKEEPGVINLVKGQLRSKVTKDYMDMADKDKSKLFIKTKTAAMGVRGTDFQTSFDPASAVTGLNVFEGSVAMAKIDTSMVGSTNTQSLDTALNGPGAVMVAEGTKAAADPESSAPPKTEVIPADEMKSAAKSDGVVEVKAVEGVGGDGGSKEEGKKEEGKKEEGKSEGKAEGKSEAKGEGKGEAKAEGKSEAKAESKSETKAEAKSDAAPKTAAPIAAPAAPVASAPKDSGSSFRDVIPPGVPKSAFTNDGAGAAKALDGVVSPSVVAKVEVQAAAIAPPPAAREPSSAPKEDFTPLAPPPPPPTAMPAGGADGPAPTTAGGEALPPPPPMLVGVAPTDLTILTQNVQQNILQTIVNTQTQVINQTIINNIGDSNTISPPTPTSTDVTFTITAQ